MQKSCSIAFLFLLIALAGCQAPKPTSNPIAAASLSHSSASHIAGKRFVTKISGASFVAAPRWFPKNDRPPLSPGAAKREAMKMVAQTVEDIRLWKLEEIILKQPIGGPLAEEYWVYQIRFSGPKYKTQFSNDNESSLYIYVLMNGVAMPVELH